MPERKFLIKWERNLPMTHGRGACLPFTMHTTANPAEYFSGILHAMPMPVFVVDDNGRFLDFNQTARRLIQAGRTDALQKRGWDVLPCFLSCFLANITP